MRKKTGATLASPLGYMGKRLLTHRVKARSPTGLAIRFGSHLARQRIRQRLFPQKTTSPPKRATERKLQLEKEAQKEA